MTKQDERQRLRRRLQEYAIEITSEDRWLDAVEVNKQILTLGEDATVYNRLGKAYMELGYYNEARDSYQQTLRLNPTNTVARKNIARIDALIGREIDHGGVPRKQRKQVDLRLFITEAGKTAITTLVEVPRVAAVEALGAGEQVRLHHNGRDMMVLDVEDRCIGKLEPRLGQRLIELINGGNRYVAAIVQSDLRQVRLLIREIYQHPSQRSRVSFPSKLNESTMYGYLHSLRYDDMEDLLDEEEIVEEPVEADEEYASSDDREIRLEEIEKDMSDDDESEE